MQSQPRPANATTTHHNHVPQVRHISPFSSSSSSSFSFRFPFFLFFFSVAVCSSVHDSSTRPQVLVGVWIIRGVSDAGGLPDVDFATGMKVFFATPTTINMGIVISEQAGGNVAVALMLTVMVTRPPPSLPPRAPSTTGSFIIYLTQLRALDFLVVYADLVSCWLGS